MLWRARSQDSASQVPRMSTQALCLRGVGDTVNLLLHNY